VACLLALAASPAAAAGLAPLTGGIGPLTVGGRHRAGRALGPVVATHGALALSEVVPRHLVVRMSPLNNYAPRSNARSDVVPPVVTGRLLESQVRRRVER